jgi:hypothetical protein
VGIFQTLAGFSPLLAATPLGATGALVGGGIMGGLAANEQNAQQEKQRKQALLLEAAGTRDSWARRDGKGNIAQAPAWNFGTEGGGLMSGVVGGIMSGQKYQDNKSLMDLLKQVTGTQPTIEEEFDQMTLGTPKKSAASMKPNLFSTAKGYA